MIFKHPHDDTVAKVLTFGGADAEIFFNYRRPTNTAWERAALQEEIGYTAHHPPVGSDRIDIGL